MTAAQRAAQITANNIANGEYGAGVRVLGTALDEFYGAWSDLAARPTVGSAQAAVQQSGAKLAIQFNRRAGEVDRIAAETRGRLEATVAEVNSLASSVAQMNRQIVANEAAARMINTADSMMQTLLDLRR